MADSIDSHELRRLLAEREPPLVIDVRRQADYAADPRTIAACDWRDPANIDRWRGELPAGRACVVYCVKGGAVSQSVAARLRREGGDVMFLAGGLKGWVASGNALEALPTK
jgi:rhodanese-related sulfurtransferase